MTCTLISFASKKDFVHLIDAHAVSEESRKYLVTTQSDIRDPSDAKDRGDEKS